MEKFVITLVSHGVGTDMKTFGVEVKVGVIVLVEPTQELSYEEGAQLQSDFRMAFIRAGSEAEARYVQQNQIILDLRGEQEELQCVINRLEDMRSSDKLDPQALPKVTVVCAELDNMLRKLRTITNEFEYRLAH